MGGAHNDASVTSCILMRRIIANRLQSCLPTRARSASLWMMAAALVIAWTSDAQATSDQARYPADAGCATASGNGDDNSMRIAQATTTDRGQLQQPPELGPSGPEALFCDLSLARRDIELLQHLEQEHERAEQLEQALAAVRRDIAAQTAPAAKASDEATELKRAAEAGSAELQKSLQQEHERAEQLEQALAAARGDIATQTALAAKASDEATELKRAAEAGSAELQKSLQQEHERAEQLEQALAAARGDIATQTALAAKASNEATELKQAAEAGSAELQKSLQRERDRTGQLEQALAAARRDVDAQTALATKASDETAKLKQDTEANSAGFQKSLQQERDRAGLLEQALAVTKRDVETQTALATKAGAEVAQLKQAAEGGSMELQKSLQQERDRTGQLEQALAAARRDIDAQTALAAKAGDEVARLTQAAKADAAEQKRSMQKEHERADALAQDLSMARTKIYAYEAQAAKASEEAAQLKQRGERYRLVGAGAATRSRAGRAAGPRSCQIQPRSRRADRAHVQGERGSRTGQAGRRARLGRAAQLVAA